MVSREVAEVVQRRAKGADIANTMLEYLAKAEEDLGVEHTAYFPRKGAHTGIQTRMGNRPVAQLFPSKDAQFQVASARAVAAQLGPSFEVGKAGDRLLLGVAAFRVDLALAALSVALGHEPGVIPEGRDRIPELLDGSPTASMSGAPKEGQSYRARLPGADRSYVFVVEHVSADQVSARRGWFQYADNGRAGPTDAWVESQETRVVPLADFQIERHLGPAPQSGDQRRAFLWGRSDAPDSEGGDPPQAATPQPWTLSVGDEILRAKLHDEFGGMRQGGISPSNESPNVFVFTDPDVGGLHGYHDEWTDGGLRYFGAGPNGDMEMIRGNRAIRDHHQLGRDLRLFQGVGGTVKYLGLCDLGGTPYEIVRAPGANGAMRNAIVFNLVPLEFESAKAVASPGGLATSYRRANERASSKPRRPNIVDPDSVDRASKAHASLQNRLADWAKSRGALILSPGTVDPNFDVAWRVGSQVTVAEVKSTTRANEVGQLRLGLGQILHYQSALEAAGMQAAAVLFVEQEPDQADSWTGLCDKHGVVLLWPERLNKAATRVFP